MRENENNRIENKKQNIREIEKNYNIIDLMN